MFPAHGYFQKKEKAGEKVCSWYGRQRGTCIEQKKSLPPRINYCALRITRNVSSGKKNVYYAPAFGGVTACTLRQILPYTLCRQARRHYPFWRPSVLY